MHNKHSKTDWQDIKAFTEVALKGTVRKASASLGVHHSTVSRRVESLEETLGVKLFYRHPQSLALTEAGEELLQTTRNFAEKLELVERRVGGLDEGLSGLVTVTMAEPLAELAFAPRLAKFNEEYPGLELELIISSSFLDVSRHEADIAIRMDNNPPSSLVGRRFFPYHDSIYASLEYCNRHDPFSNPEAVRWLGWERYDNPFPEWTQSTEYADAPIWGSFPDLRVQLAATKAGLGISMLPCFVADREKELIRITNQAPIPSRDIWLLTHRDLQRTARVRAFMDFATKTILGNKKALTGQ